MKICAICELAKKLPYKQGTTCAQCYLREYKTTNREKVTKQIKAWQFAHRDEIAAQQKRKYAENPHAARARNKRWYEKNKHNISPEILAYRKEYQRNRTKNDPSYRIGRNLRVRISNLIKGRRKCGSAIRDLGCSLEQLKLHLESLFQPGMTWENYGDWHIDHKRPLASFDLEDRTQFIEACHYTNLQPLWAAENIRKGAKF